MKSFFERLRNALKPCSGIVHSPRTKLSRPQHEIRGRRHSTVGAALVSRGSIALAKFPIVTTEEMKERRNRIQKYDFNTLK